MRDKDLKFVFLCLSVLAMIGENYVLAVALFVVALAI